MLHHPGDPTNSGITNFPLTVCVYQCYSSVSIMTIGKSTLSRRTFLITSLAPLLVPAQAKDPWSDVSSILARIKPPKFPARDFNIVQFGADANGRIDSSPAIVKAIASCHD